jgi:hypothetical protein
MHAATALGREAGCPKQIANASPGFLDNQQMAGRVALVRRLTSSRSRMQDVGKARRGGGRQACAGTLATAFTSNPAITTKTTARRRRSHTQFQMVFM